MSKKDDKFLAVKRAKQDKIFGGMWGLPGGQIEKGESVFQAAKRELKEETNLDLISLEENFCLKGRLDIPSYPPILLFVYKGKVSSGIPSPNDSDVEKIKWIKAVPFLNSLKKKNYPSKEIKNFTKFLISEGLLNLSDCKF